jgi:hypothetical protein
MIFVIAVWRGSADGLWKSSPASCVGGEAMLNFLEEFRRYPTIDNAARLRDYFERYPSRVWLLPSDSLRVLEAAGVNMWASGMRYDRTEHDRSQKENATRSRIWRTI